MIVELRVRIPVLTSPNGDAFLIAAVPFAGSRQMSLPPNLGPDRIGGGDADAAVARTAK